MEGFALLKIVFLNVQLKTEEKFCRGKKLIFLCYLLLGRLFVKESLLHRRCLFSKSEIILLYANLTVLSCSSSFKKLLIISFRKKRNGWDPRSGSRFPVPLRKETHESLERNTFFYSTCSSINSRQKNSIHSCKLTALLQLENPLKSSVNAVGH